MTKKISSRQYLGNAEPSRIDGAFPEYAADMLFTSRYMLDPAPIVELLDYL